MEMLVGKPLLEDTVGAVDFGGGFWGEDGGNKAL